MKLWYCILVFKNPRKLVIIWPFLIIFSPVFLVWKLDQERQNILHIFIKYSNQGLFSADENLILKLFMFRPQNLLEKLRKCLCCCHFCSVLDALKLVWEILERHQIFSRYSTPCIFSLTKCLTYYFIFIPKKLLENTKMSKKDNFQSFLPIFLGVELSLGNIEKPSNFQKMF